MVDGIVKIPGAEVRIGSGDVLSFRIGQIFHFLIRLGVDMSFFF